MSRLLGILAAFALLVVIAVPGSADAAQRADGLKNPSEYGELSAQRRAYVRRAYPRRYYGRGYARPYGGYGYGYGPYWGAPAPFPLLNPFWW